MSSNDEFSKIYFLESLCNRKIIVQIDMSSKSFTYKNYLFKLKSQLIF